MWEDVKVSYLHASTHICVPLRMTVRKLQRFMVTSVPVHGWKSLTTIDNVKAKKPALEVKKPALPSFVVLAWR